MKNKFISQLFLHIRFIKWLNMRNKKNDEDQKKIKSNIYLALAEKKLSEGKLMEEITKEEIEQ